MNKVPYVRGIAVGGFDEGIVQRYLTFLPVLHCPQSYQGAKRLKLLFADPLPHLVYRDHDKASSVQGQTIGEASPRVLFWSCLLAGEI